MYFLLPSEFGISVLLLLKYQKNVGKMWIKIYLRTMKQFININYVGLPPQTDGQPDRILCLKRQDRDTTVVRSVSDSRWAPLSIKY